MGSEMCIRDSRTTTTTTAPADITPTRPAIETRAIHDGAITAIRTGAAKCAGSPHDCSFRTHESLHQGLLSASSSWSRHRRSSDSSWRTFQEFTPRQKQCTFLVDQAMFLVYQAMEKDEEPGR